MGLSSLCSRPRPFGSTLRLSFCNSLSPVDCKVLCSRALWFCLSSFHSTRDVVQGCNISILLTHCDYCASILWLWKCLGISFSGFPGFSEFGCLVRGSIDRSVLGSEGETIRQIRGSLCCFLGEMCTFVSWVCLCGHAVACLRILMLYLGNLS